MNDHDSSHDRAPEIVLGPGIEVETSIVRRAPARLIHRKRVLPSAEQQPEIQ
jgi:hypothetical protein